jgi:hypothetical protein
MNNYIDSAFEESEKGVPGARLIWILYSFTIQALVAL